MFSILDVRSLIAQRPGVSLRDLALHFKVSPGMMEMMLDKLISRGDVECFVAASCCGGECGCNGGHHKSYKLTLKGRQALEAAQP